MSEALDDQQLKRAAMEALFDAGPAGLPSQGMDAVIDELEKCHVAACLWQLWEAGELRVSWNPDDGPVWISNKSRRKW